VNVLFVSPVGEAGGAENLMLDVATQLRARGHVVTLLALGEGPLADVATARGVPTLADPVTPVLDDPRNVAHSVRAVRAAVRATRPDGVVASHPKSHLLCLLAGVPFGRPLLVQLYDPRGARSAIDTVSWLVPARRAAIAAHTAASYRLGPRRVPVVPPGVDLQAIRERAARGDHRNVLAAAGLDEGDALVVMVARLQRFKGPVEFVRMAGLLRAAHPGARFVVIGADSPGDPGLRDELRATIHDAGLAGTTGLAGYVTADDLAATMAAADLLVHPATRETFGLVLVEAMALGTPVVATEGPGPSLILAGGGGTLVPSNDPAALAAAVAPYLADPDRRATAGAEAVALAAAHDAARLGPAYERLLARRRVRAS
jgi:glycosyltransferase involved in cell wall biosynthesis